MKDKNFYYNQKGEFLTVLAVTVCIVLGIISGMTTDKNFSPIIPIDVSGDLEVVSQENEIKLPTFKSKQEILDKVAENKNNNGYFWVTNDAMDFAVMESESALAGSVSKGEMVDNVTNRNESVIEKDYSETNTQVQGVDEADIIKTNGDYIYYLSKGNLYIFETKTTKTKLIKTISLENANRYATQELYIDDNYIIILVEEDIKDNTIKEKQEESNKIVYDYVYPNYRTNGTTIYVYDINNYELVKTVTTEGSYVSSRKINNNIYVVTNKYLYPYSVNEDNVLPIYRDICHLPLKDDLIKTDFEEIPATEICYFPDMEEKQECNYMLITSINLENVQDKANIDTYLGAGNEIYCSKENLYVTKIEYNNDFRNNTLENRIFSIDEEVFSERVTTRIHKFNLLNGSVAYVATGEVKGSLLNQYSMDEYDGYFRITTTADSGNNLFVLDKDLKIVGNLQNLAKGEKIYATRFMGDKCYLVTYKTVDPLFVIDLSKPTNPTVLGELKIPGYSTYLHPLGENYLIGFGEDSVEKSYLNWKGDKEVIAYNVGMKLAIFDISELDNPKEIHSIKIGGRGSYSELLNNPKVLYWDEESGIFAFPASLTEETKFYEDGTPMYGNVIFEGALVYNLDIEKGIELRGQIEHEENLEKYNSNNIERIIRIGKNFYTVSPNMLKVTNIETMEEIKEGTCKFYEN